MAGAWVRVARAGLSGEQGSKGMRHGLGWRGNDGHRYDFTLLQIVVMLIPDPSLLLGVWVEGEELRGEFQ